jgi:hypothetical protein
MITEMIKVLVSTLSTQGSVPGDYSFVPEGELVGRYGLVCDRERKTGLSGCGCGRGFGGFSTYRATTSALVAERDMTILDWRSAAHQTLRDTGWSRLLGDVELGDVLDEMVEFDLLRLRELEIGTIVGRRAWNDSRGIQDHLVLRGQVVRSWHQKAALD